MQWLPSDFFTDRMIMDVRVCSRCSFQCICRLQLIKHCFESHSYEPTFRVECRIRGCCHVFTFWAMYSSFKTHASGSILDGRRMWMTVTLVALLPMSICPHLKLFYWTIHNKYLCGRHSWWIDVRASWQRLAQAGNHCHGDCETSCFPAARYSTYTFSWVNSGFVSSHI